MRRLIAHFIPAVLSLACAMPPAAAWAQQATSLPPNDAPSPAPNMHPDVKLPTLNTPVKVEDIKVSGNKRVSTEAIMAVVPFHVGSMVTQAQITQGLQDIMKLYQQQNIGGKFHQSLSLDGKRVKVGWAIEETGGPADFQKPLVLESLGFDGNLHVSTSALKEAVHRQPGEQVTPATVLADEKAIQALYVKKNIGVTIVPESHAPHKDERVTLTYHLTEKAND
ncbi:POTRA domain-containing protein [Acetobacter malorum]|uniref:POTRA domain-containing protein n=1 Tax=Acetobacter malorum TaxID=178901 RepID=UPI0007777878|nr:POTRA domain-containing protein [Acetobacter malorum]